MYLCTRKKIWTSFSCLVLLKCYHVVFSQFKIPANFAQLAVPKMHCVYANAVVQPSVQHCPCYMAWKTKVHTWCRHCHLRINAPMWREKRWLQGIIDPPSYIVLYMGFQSYNRSESQIFRITFWNAFLPHMDLSMMKMKWAIIPYFCKRIPEINIYSSQIGLKED